MRIKIAATVEFQKLVLENAEHDIHQALGKIHPSGSNHPVRRIFPSFNRAHSGTWIGGRDTLRKAFLNRIQSEDS
jgi:hypothetical protein